MGMRQYNEIQIGRIEGKRIMVARFVYIAALEHAAVYQEAAAVGFDVET